MRRAVLLAAIAAFASAAPAPAATYTLRQLGAGADISARGGVSDATTFVRVPAGFDVGGGSVAIRFSHSPLVRADRSTVTLMANDVPLTSERLSKANAGGGLIRAQLPRMAAPDGGFTLTARFSMRLTRDPCEDPSNPALWARVSAASTVTPKLVPARRTLRNALVDLFPDQPTAPLPIVLPSSPSDAQLRAAGFAAAAYARAAGDHGRDAFVAAASGAPSGRAIRIATPGAAGTAITSGGQPQLTIGGSDPARSARALASTRSVALPWRKSAASFAQLGIGPREVTGPGVSTIVLPAQRPPQWTVPRTGYLDLAVSPSAGLQPGSSVTASIAGHELGSRKLVPGSGSQRLRFDAKDGLLDTDLDGRAVRMIPISLRFDLQVHHTGCTPLDIDAARATVLETSSITLDHGTTDELDLSRFPAPLALPDHGATIVVPDQPSTAELSAGLQLAAAAARFADPAAPLPELARARAVRADAAKRDLILVGSADSQLGHAVKPPSVANPGAGGGTLVLAKSPWSGDHDVLAVKGADDAGLALATRALSSTTALGQLVGRAVVVRPRGGGATPAGGSPQGKPPIALAPIKDEGFWSSLPAWAVPAAVVLAALLVTGVAVARRRWRGRIRV